MLEELIDNFAKGKIEIKFQLARPLLSNKKRKTLLVIGMVIFLFGTFYFVPLIIVKLKLPDFFVLVGLLLFWLSYDRITKKFLFQIEPVGLVKFLPEHIEIKYLDQRTENNIPYSEIKGIEFQYNVPRTVLTKVGDTKTVIVEIFRYKTSSIVFEAENQIFFTDQDKLEFRALEPSLDVVLKQYIKTKYGTKNVKRITTPNSTLV